ncbi:hypothetical protein Poli38472_006771 [Pythium oligandrum]|uniref:PH domain-containing protein n=1 Tax=Pythium oligandrum TaxID=41045 RepID=A0A8K1FC35_PYTOL|nr:hypothetical protein Poli38472_006771 [Pythium oligandrum]|eukprot:TMW56761.1 hypothetical protein Poli38472_006771 [Pythium oligandrum]
MSTGGNVEGYLFKIEGNEARIVYCILDEGILQYYTHMGGPLIGCVPLTGCKVDVFLLPNEPERIQHQFRVDSTARAARKRSMGPASNAQRVASTQQQHKTSTTFAASTADVMDRWAVSVLNWNRYSWDDPQTLCSSKDEHATLKALLQQSPSMKLKRTPSIPLGVSRAVKPL